MQHVISSPEMVLCTASKCADPDLLEWVAHTVITNHHSTTGTPQGCALSLLPSTPSTNHCQSPYTITSYFKPSVGTANHYHSAATNHFHYTG